MRFGHCVGNENNEGTAKVSSLFEVHILGGNSSCRVTLIMHFTTNLMYTHDEYVSLNGLDSAQHALAFQFGFLR